VGAARVVTATEPLGDLCRRLRETPGMQHKRDIALAYRGLGPASELARNGDDCAAIADGDGYSLFAIEGLIEEFVRREPWFAGYCAVMVNVSDVAAMGGRALAVVDALWAAGSERAEPILAGMRAAAAAYGVPIVGGHTNLRSDADRLAVAILGRATKLLSSFGACAGDELLVAVDLRGAYVDPYPYWNCSTHAPPERLRADLELFPALAEDELCTAAKDISMGGVLGTLLMLLECSNVGAGIDLARIPKPAGVALERWLVSFPSFGYLLTAPPGHVAEIRRRFGDRAIACESVGACTAERSLTLSHLGETETFWELERTPFMGVHVPA